MRGLVACAGLNSKSLSSYRLRVVLLCSVCKVICFYFHIICYCTTSFIEVQQSAVKSVWPRVGGGLEVRRDRAKVFCNAFTLFCSDVPYWSEVTTPRPRESFCVDMSGSGKFAYRLRQIRNTSEGAYGAYGGVVHHRMGLMLA